ncbi:MAG: PASTA domain-containing protein [Erysipelotrichaceae bacterium]|nr:PASTA domain-containing protein [Erysipelotrichaceae bacterium]
MKKFFSNKINILLTVCLVCVLACVSVLAFNLLGIGKGKEVIAQDFTGKTVSEVMEWINTSKLPENRYSIIYEYDEEIPENVLIYQSVKEGDVIREGISFVFSKGADPSTAKKTVTVPDFSALSEEEIKKWGEDNKINVSIDYAYSDSIDKGKLISQSVAANGEVEENSSIFIVISNGKSDSSGTDIITVPDSYLGYKEADFIKAIQNLGLVPSKQSKTYKNPNYKNGTVYSYQSSSDGIRFKKGDTVKYYLVDNGDAEDVISVPDSYLGYKEADFIKAIEALGLKTAKQSKTYTSTRLATGTVYAYDSSSDGIIFKKGDTVKYYLVDNGDGSQDDTTVIVPDDYIGYSEANFITAIKDLGLNPVKQTKTYTSTRLATGTIYAYDSTSDGITFKKGDNVKYYLVDNHDSGSSEPDMGTTDVTLANLVGKTQSEAESYLSKNNLQVNINRAYSSTVAAGNVISMSPSAGTTVKSGSTVTLTISQGVETASLLAPNMLISNYSRSTYQDTVNALSEYFSSAGFTNVSYSGVKSTKSIGQIISIAVNGNSSYSAGEYPKNTNITVEIVNERIS